MKKFIVPAAVLALSACSFGFTYSINDGTPEDSIGLNTSSASIYWSTSFTATAGNTNISSVSVMFGFNTGTFATNGTAVRISLVRDANNDGIADTGGLVSDLSSTVTGANTNAFQVYNIPDFNFAAGDGFVVSVILQNGPTNTFPATIDQTAPVSNRNYIAFDTAATIDANNVSAVAAAQRGFVESFGLPGNWMINAEATSVPEPASMAVLGFGALAVLRRRRNKKA